MKAALAALVVAGLVVAGCDESMPGQDQSAPTLQRALVEQPVSNIMAARALMRDLARGCDGVALHPAIERQIDAIRQTRQSEFDVISSPSVMRAARPFSADFDRRHGQAFNLLTRRGPPTPDLCRAARAEAEEAGLMGLMLVRT